MRLEIGSSWHDHQQTRSKMGHFRLLSSWNLNKIGYFLKGLIKNRPFSTLKWPKSEKIKIGRNRKLYSKSGIFRQNWHFQEILSKFVHFRDKNSFRIYSKTFIFGLKWLYLRNRNPKLAIFDTKYLFSFKIGHF